MPANLTADSDLRAVNAKIAGSYDLVPYEAAPMPGIDPDKVFGLAALYTATPQTADFDVLDLGCGTGSLLERVAGLTGGRVVGTDLSRFATERATQRGASFGPRYRVMCADFMDLNPAELGQFDLIYNIGVLYVAPPEVQKRILSLIAACLKPNGVAVISYYFGAHALQMAGLHEMLCLAIDADAPPPVQVQQAKECLRDIAKTLAPREADNKSMLSVLQQAFMREDSIFFHEFLSQKSSVPSTSSLEIALRAGGVHFLDWMTPVPVGNLALPHERAAMADAIDLGGGGYHYSVFSKSSASTIASPRAANIRWHSRLVRGIGPDGQAAFRDEARGLIVTPNLVTEIALDMLAEGPCDWNTLLAAIEKKLAAQNKLVKNATSVLEQELLTFWRYGAGSPIWSPAT